MRVLFVFLLLFSLQPPDRPKLLVIGDSLTQGLAATGEAQTFKHILARSLGASLGSAHATRLEDAEKVSLAWGPDIIVLEIGLNDVLSQTLDLQYWDERYEALIRKFVATGAVVVVATPFHGLYKGHPKYAAMDQMAQYMRYTAGARTADLWAIECVPGCLSQAEDSTPFPPLYRGDNFHPNDHGHALIAGVILHALRPHTLYLPLA